MEWKIIIHALAYHERWLANQGLDGNTIRHQYHQRSFNREISDEPPPQFFADMGPNIFAFHHDTQTTNFYEPLEVDEKYIYVVISPVGDHLILSMYEVDLHCDDPYEGAVVIPTSLRKVDTTITCEQLFETYQIIPKLLEKYEPHQLLRSF